jgi:hypothetical protein
MSYHARELLEGPNNMQPDEPTEEAKEAERQQWREWLLQQEDRLEVEKWLRERLLSERKLIFDRVARCFERSAEIQELRNEIQELRTELNAQRAAKKADVIDLPVLWRRSE